MSEFIITQDEINKNHVQAAPDVLRAVQPNEIQDNKKIFDKLPELIAQRHNALAEYVSESVYDKEYINKELNKKANAEDVYTRDETFTKEEIASAINNAVFETGSADMNKAVYDKNNSGVVDNAEKVNGFWFDFFDEEGNPSDEPYIHWGGAPVIEGIAEEAQF